MVTRIGIGLMMLLVVGCGGGEGDKKAKAPGDPPAPAGDTFQLTSSGFAHKAVIDAKYTGAGGDVSPPLAWTNLPDDAESLALICDDPDAPSEEPWVHWVIYNISTDASSLPPAVSRDAEPGAVPGARQGQNSWPDDNLGYRGPAPPAGDGPHEYHFKLYALDAKLELEAGATKQELLAAMEPHIVGETTLIGTCEQQ